MSFNAYDQLNRALNHHVVIAQEGASELSIINRNTNTLVSGRRRQPKAVDDKWQLVNEMPIKMHIKCRRHSPVLYANIMLNSQIVYYINDCATQRVCV